MVLFGSGQVSMFFYHCQALTLTVHCIYRDSLDISLKITSNDGVATTYSQRLSVQEPVDDFLIGDFVHIGGTENDLSAFTNGLYQAGLRGCIIQIRASVREDIWQRVNLQEDALSGGGISVCII
jgi:hypothetical protein